MSFLDEIKMADLPEEQQEIAEAVGMDGYLNLVRQFGGLRVQILKEKTLIKARRDERIRQLYRKGIPIEKLALDFHLRDRTIRNIVYGRRADDGNTHCPG